MMNKRINLSVRDARDDERAAIRTVTLAAYEEYAAVMPQPFWKAYRQQLLATLDEEGPVARIVAEHEGTIVGSVLLYPPQASAYTGVAVKVTWPEVRLLAVVPAARGQSVGSALMDECERRARLAGATQLGLHTMDMMQTAVRLYERRGFIRAPELDFYPAQGVVVKGYRLNL
ncbi:MAG TPA: GNAT family N-acetyltransferase [Ktedonobacteraceae bacterium]|jgi:GNAT superfamily N-acetyltransferase|nr:GNAT family N-acetyltransferase [Ktedonobacteraceae bacterium]